MQGICYTSLLKERYCGDEGSVADLTPGNDSAMVNSLHKTCAGVPSAAPLPANNASLAF